ncbi:MAG: helix-turn-helix transcriptional regulator [Methylococcales bacterium]|nr:helix-turn-helix transcriptional regulator [Methylococcales bacterium]
MTTAAPKTSKTAEYIRKQIDKSSLKQKQISEALGFKTPNLITMIKQGSIKIPLYLIPKLAEVLKVDPAKLLSMALKEYNPDTYAAVKSVFGYPITEVEAKILEKVQEVASYSDIETSEELQSYLDKLDSKLK